MIGFVLVQGKYDMHKLAKQKYYLLILYLFLHMHTICRAEHRIYKVV